MVVDKESTGPYREAFFTKEDLRELQYASLLHDFGKIGVREPVLVKAKKLFPHDLASVRSRFDFVVRTLEVEVLDRKLRAMSRNASPEELEQLDRDFEGRRTEIEDAWKTVMSANEPTVLAAGDFKRIE